MLLCGDVEGSGGEGGEGLSQPFDTPMLNQSNLQDNSDLLEVEDALPEPDWPAQTTCYVRACADDTGNGGNRAEGGGGGCGGVDNGSVPALAPAARTCRCAGGLWKRTWRGP